MRWKFILLILGIMLLSSVSAAVIWGEYVSTSFETTSDRPECVDGFNWKKWDLIVGEYVYTPSENDCYRPAGPEGEGYPTTKCCVYGEAACDITEVPATCTLGPIFYCEDYTSLGQTDCEEPDFGVPEATLERYYGEGFCGSHQSYVDEFGVTCDVYIMDCTCKWVDGECLGDYTVSDPNCWGDEDPITPAGGCSIELIEKLDECDTTGFIKYFWNAIWDGTEECDEDDDCDVGFFCDTDNAPFVCRADSCVDDEKRIRCATKLLFFTITTFIITILVIIIVYLIWNKQIKKKRGK